MTTNQLFGRDDIIGILDKRIQGFRNGYRQNVTILGRSLMGKTSILRAILSRQTDCPSFLPIFISLPGRSLRQVIHSLCLQILSNFLRGQGVEVDGDLRHLIARSQAFLPKTISRIETIYLDLDKGKDYAALSRALELTQDISSEANLRCLLVFDEFQEMGRLVGEEIFNDWGKKILVQKNTMYLISSSYPVRAREILANGLSLLFGNFEVLDVDPYGIALSCGFIRANLKKAISERYIQLLVDFSGGCPFYLDKICRELSRQAARRKLAVIDEDAFVLAWENLLWDRWGLFNLMFSQALGSLLPERQRGDYLDILVSLASGYSRAKDIALHLGWKEKNIQQRLSRFYPSGLVVKNGDFFCFGDKLFAFWFKAVYLPRVEKDYVDPQALREGFRRQLSGVMREFFTTMRKPTIERIRELFNLFRNEAVRIERKKWTLSHFKEVRMIRPENNNFQGLILARAPEAFWLVAVARGHISDGDISDFVQECRKYGRPRRQKRIIISFSCLKTNVRLKALEEKVVTWETRDLNYLFGAYNRPGVIQL